MNATPPVVTSPPTPPASEVVLPILWGVLILLIILVAAALLVIYLGRWAKRAESGPVASAGLLSEFRSLYERGECSREEFERIRAKLGQQLREELKVATGAVPPPEPAAASDGDAQKRLPAAAGQPTIGRAAGPTGDAAAEQS